MSLDKILAAFYTCTQITTIFTTIVIQLTSMRLLLPYCFATDQFH